MNFSPAITLSLWRHNFFALLYSYHHLHHKLCKFHVMPPPPSWIICSHLSSVKLRDCGIILKFIHLITLFPIFFFVWVFKLFLRLKTFPILFPSISQISLVMIILNFLIKFKLYRDDLKKLESGKINEMEMIIFAKVFFYH